MCCRFLHMFTLSQQPLFIQCLQTPQLQLQLQLQQAASLFFCRLSSCEGNPGWIRLCLSPWHWLFSIQPPIRRSNSLVKMGLAQSRKLKKESAGNSNTCHAVVLTIPLGSSKSITISRYNDVWYERELHYIPGCVLYYSLVNVLVWINTICLYSVFFVCTVYVVCSICTTYIINCLLLLVPELF